MQQMLDQPAAEIPSDLGSLKADFRVSAVVLAAYALLVVAGTGAAVFLIWQQASALEAGHGSLDGLVPAGIGLGILVILACFSYAYGVPIYRNRGLRVRVYEHGFVCLRQGRTSACRWDDVTRVWQVIRCYGRNYWRWIEVRSRQGDKWVFDNRTDLLDNFWGLTDVIENEVARRMLPRALADIRAGRPWLFGDLRLTRDGLEYGGEFLPWRQFKEASCDGLAIAFRRHGAWQAWKRIGTDQVPNLRLLLTLVRQLGQEIGTTSEGTTGVRDRTST
jgi:hypothetical protein